VYYSGFSPIPEPSKLLPLKPPPLIREHRLYQADWLLRFYGFKVEELTPASDPRLRLEIDPKLAWALKNRAMFPIDVNKAPKELLCRVPGLGIRNVTRIVTARRHCRLHVADLKRLRLNLGKCLPFLIAADHIPRARLLESEALISRFLPMRQMEIDFNQQPPSATAADALDARSGEF
jgi:predicted DNA-binding helix-hairpin-helix protein